VAQRVTHHPGNRDPINWGRSRDPPVRISPKLGDLPGTAGSKSFTCSSEIDLLIGVLSHEPLCTVRSADQAVAKEWG